ncbi:MAG: hypothetical protein Q9162_002444 [Coniocarpon cinnabarinum]
MIVERPERMQAGMLGLATAYVRLGGRHANGSHPPTPRHEPIADVPFRIRKTARTIDITSPIVAAVHGTKWMQELKMMCDTAGEKLACGQKELSRPDTPAAAPGSTSKPYLHEGDLYLCKDSRDALEGALGGVCEAVDTVFDDSVDARNCKKAFVCIRPPGHHCSADWPSGFCWINNVHVGIEHAIQHHSLTHAAIIDFDLHHGDGSQAIAWERNARSLKAQKSTAKNAAFKRSSVGYFSIHDINSYPCEDGDFNKVQRASVCIENAHAQNIWNVHLQPWTTEADFWRLYETQYLVLLEKARAYLQSTTQRLKATAPGLQPKAAIFISAGFDASEWETPTMQRHKMNVPTAFYARMTSDIVKLANEEGMATDGRVISVLEGGYSERAISSGVFSHLAGLANYKADPNATLMPSEEVNLQHRWDPSWWSDTALRELEDMMKPIAPPPAPVKKPSGPKEVPTYQTPTQSFTAKVVDPGKIQRHTSINVLTPPKSRPSTPPPPEVDWATAACQLSRLLVPSEDRQVNSCRHEELNEPKKRERHSSIGIQTVQTETAGERRQTRGRKTQQDALFNKTPLDRRQSISDLPIHPEVSEEPVNAVTGIPVSSSNKSSRPAAPKPRQASGEAASGLNVAKTRRTSLRPGALAEPSDATVTRPSNTGNQNNNSSTSNASVDSLTSGMNKITLKIPKTTAPSAAPAVAKQAPKKPAAPRATKKASSKPAPAAEKAAEITKEIANSALLGGENNAGIASIQARGDDSETAPPPSPSNVIPQATTTNTSTNENPANPAAPLVTEVMGQASAGTSTTPAENATASVASVDNGIIPDSQDALLPQEDSETSETSHLRNDGQTGLEFIPYRPHGARQDTPSADTNFRQEPLQWLPPNTGTPKKQVPSGKENHLPAFSSTGHIPFPKNAINPAEALNDSEQAKTTIEEVENLATRDEREFQSVWDVPVTPQAK